MKKLHVPLFDGIKIHQSNYKRMPLSDGDANVWVGNGKSSTGTYWMCPDCGQYAGIFLYTNMVCDVTKTRKEALEGKYGQEWKELLENNNLAIVDSDQDVFVCDHCKYWNVYSNLSVYEPISEDEAKSVLRTLKQENSIYERAIEQIMPERNIDGKPKILEFTHRLIKEYVHVCEECGSHMRVWDGISKLSCPNCKSEKESEYIYFIQ